MPNAAELRELDDEELEGRLIEYRREMLNLRFQLATGQLDNVVRLSVVRKDVARVLTVLRDREIALAEGRDAGPVPQSPPLASSPRRGRRGRGRGRPRCRCGAPERQGRKRSTRSRDVVDDEDGAVPEGDGDADEEDE